ncbi:5-carboxymethyl-2-hydroxymuconate Delta-isomerase [Psychrosphaera algicola]|uniref:5-carboxymethyl-2-hydroxymuconate Delta-isomerase n=1 Tax=Psychrosphaera algicola TaxID=3023714 RepID=A0ABT5F8W6_9GAMM|nr:5-carboxymethyl-2-hydroxymuconate Delta-isomerase [Psychrosphaera sp. G1-22]MDC2887984.1 5-carboxymethyl-2-hydroxymuconate Delta-isomerase [Psychrosphaera sp. G1-22]
MPHFVIDCSKNVLAQHDEKSVISGVHKVAFSTGLFDEGDIKVRVNAFDTFLVGAQTSDFIHVFAHIMEGRNIDQKAMLSHEIVKHLVSLFPSVNNIAMNIYDFEKATYCNRAMLIAT